MDNLKGLDFFRYHHNRTAITLTMKRNIVKPKNASEACHKGLKTFSDNICSFCQNTYRKSNSVSIIEHQISEERICFSFAISDILTTKRNEQFLHHIVFDLLFNNALFSSRTTTTTRRVMAT